MNDNFSHNYHDYTELRKEDLLREYGRFTRNRDGDREESWYRNHRHDGLRTRGEQCSLTLWIDSDYDVIIYSDIF